MMAKHPHPSGALSEPCRAEIGDVSLAMSARPAGHTTVAAGAKVSLVDAIGYHLAPRFDDDYGAIGLYIPGAISSNAARSQARHAPRSRDQERNRSRSARSRRQRWPSACSRRPQVSREELRRRSCGTLRRCLAALPQRFQPAGEHFLFAPDRGSRTSRAVDEEL